METIATYNLYFNTLYKDSGTIDYCQFNLKNPIVLQHSESFLTVKLTSMELPFSWNTLRGQNCTVSYLTNFTITPYTFRIPDGNYNISTLITAFCNGLQASILKETNHTRTFNCTFNRDTQFCTFGLDYNNTANFNTFITINYSSCPFICRMMGFTSDIILKLDNVGVQTITISSQPVNVNMIRAIYFRSDTLFNCNNLESVNGKSRFSDILQKIQVNVAPSNYILFDGSSANKTRISASNISTVSIYLSDDETDDQDAIPLQLDFSFSLLVEECRIVSDIGSLPALSVDHIITPPPPDPSTDLLKQREELLQKINIKRNKLQSNLV